MTLPFLLIVVIRMEDQSKKVSAATLSAFLRRAQRSVGLSGRVHVLITANEQMRKLNRRFRGKNKPTDVLSFPASAEVQSPESHAGDLAISLEIARANAKQLGHSVEDEIKVLLLHGVLHLAGHDHESDNGEMAALEERLRTKLHLPAALIARSSQKEKGSSRKEKRPGANRARPVRKPVKAGAARLPGGRQ